MNNENLINNNSIKVDAINQIDSGVMINQMPNTSQGAVENNESSVAFTKKKSGKIIFNEDPIAFEIKEVEEKNETDENDNIQINDKTIEKTELPKEQSGNITF